MIEALVIALASIALTAILTGLSYFLKKSLDTLEDVRNKIAEHDKADVVLTEKVDGVQRDLSEFKSDTKESLLALNNKTDRILEILAAERQAA